LKCSSAATAISCAESCAQTTRPSAAATAENASSGLTSERNSTTVALFAGCSSPSDPAISTNVVTALGVILDLLSGGGELTEDPEARRRLMTFAIVGGGPTGVEMSGAIAEVARQTLRSDFRRIDPGESRIVLLEAGPRLLPSFPEPLARYAESALRRMGVQVLTSARVTACDEHGVQLANQLIEAATSIWAAGVKASPAAAWVEVPHDRNGRIKARPNLSVPDAPDIFAIGDTALILDHAARPVPGIAPAAKQMGRYVGQVINARVRGKGSTAVQVSPLRRPGNDRTQVGCCAARSNAPPGLHGLAVLERGAHLFPHRGEKPADRRVHLVVEQSHVPAWGAADHVTIANTPA
jgi:Pyridine nucleotide-disulphide oxidoreductase